MRTFALFFFSSVGLGTILAVASCAAFSGEPATTEDGAADAPSDAPDANASNDGAAAMDGAAALLRLPCPPPSGGTTSVDQWRTRILFAPANKANRMYPFAISSDATHVTWLAQPGTVDGGDDTEPYNGRAGAMVLRTPKSGAGPTAVLARDQFGATGLTLDDTFAYWVVNEPGGTILRRQSWDVDCSVACPSPTSVASFPGGTRIERLIRPAPHVLFALGGNGVLYRHLIGSAIVSPVATSGDLPGVTATSDDVFVGSALSAMVQRAPVGGGASTTELVVPATDASVGVQTFATDCTTLWMGRAVKPGGDEIVAHQIGVDGSFAAGPPFGQITEIHDLGVDARYVYAAAFNAGGIFVLDKSMKVTTHPYAGNVFNVAVDDDGVYFGEHDRGAAGGAGTLYMLVKQ